MLAYYNEIDPYAAQWLRNLIAAGHIAPGDVDERSITEVQPDDLKGYTQCHFFAGIGGWSLALRLAGWPDDEPVWTGSCPCQPFSSAGQRKGIEDERHLWPEFYRLISECKPPVVFGEQVASKDGRSWLASVRADLETVGYAVGAADLCAAGVGAPHIRQRLWWVADANDARLERRRQSERERATERAAGPDGVVDGLADAKSDRNDGPIWDYQRQEISEVVGRSADLSELGSTSPPDSHWRDADWLHCRDGKWRPVEPGTFPLAARLPGRVGRLRAYGNAIVPQVAAQFIGAYSAALKETT